MQYLLETYTEGSHSFYTSRITPDASACVAPSVYQILMGLLAPIEHRVVVKPHEENSRQRPRPWPHELECSPVSRR